MKQEDQLQLFEQEVKVKYRVYNSLFTSLPYEKMENISALLPFMSSLAKKGFADSKTPIEVMDTFFERFTDLESEEERIDLLFRFIQYIERQVVLFDSVEDAAFKPLNDLVMGGTLANIYQLAKQDDKLKEVQDKLNSFSVRLVFTAHPTQFYPNSVLRIMQDLRDAIQRSDITTIDSLLQQLGKTAFYKKTKPSPFDEAMSIVYYLRNVYYETIGKLLEDANSIFFPEGGFQNFQLVQLGFWPGGDRDGNPFVTADITRKVSDELRFAVLKCYYKDLKTLSRSLTFSGVYEIMETLRARVYENMFGLKRDLRYPDMIDALQKARSILIEKHDSLFLSKLDALIFKVRAFGLHFASLDVRQDSRIHTGVIASIFEKYSEVSNYGDLDEAEKLKLLSQANFKAQPDDFEEEIVVDTLANIHQIGSIQKANGELAIHRYIISNCETVSDVLHVFYLFKWCGYKEEDINIDIVPLFETMRGLSGAEATMNILYNEEPYKSHLAKRGVEQTVMLGFSDGTKDGGYLKANWEIFRTKEVLTRVSEKNHVKVLFFDGRGGPPARGGGKTHRFYASQGKTIANHQIQLTIQGQTITSLYGTVNQTYSNMEQLISAGVITDIFDLPENDLGPKERGLMEKLAKDAYQKYEDLKAHPKFVPYLENMSTLPYYGKTNIGSRPSKRGGGGALSLDKLRAIPFVGSWSQLKQNVPGYFGLGTAIAMKKEEGKLQEVKDLYQSSAFFKTLVLNSMMAMTKTYFPLTTYMSKNPEYSEFWNILHQEFELSVKMVLEISGADELMQEEALSKASIEMREDIVLPLLSIQQYALQKIQQDAAGKEIYEKMVTRSLFGNINASRNSA